MKINNYVVAAVVAATLAACGGGGGSAGTPAFGGGTGGGTTNPGTGGGTDTAPAYMMTLQLQNASGGELAGSSFAASDTVKFLATLKTAAGAPAPNEVVTFAESGSGLLQFTPISGTALTNSSGQAVIEAKAGALNALGATSVSATATLAGTAYTAARNLAVTGAVVEGVDPQTLVRGVNFDLAIPADRSIVIAGAGGNGRSETAILQFKVVDGAGAVVPGARVAFESVPANVVTLNSATGTTDASGIVSASVSSKAAPTSVVVKASVVGTPYSTSSDSLTVTTGVAVAERFDLSASKFVLNRDISGDASTIRVGVADAGGNPVADGFAVVAITDYGRVGTSSRGGCVTANGICTIEYQVQNPRPLDGTPISVTVSGNTGAGATISDTILLNATSVSQISLYRSGSATPLTSFSGLEFDASCKAVWTGELGTAAGFAAPAGATLTALSFRSQAAVSLTSGAPVPDSLNARTRVALTFTLSSATVPGDAPLEFTVQAGNFRQTLVATLNYPACTPAT